MEYAGSIHIVFILKLLDQTIALPRSQTLQRLDYVINQKVPLRCNQLHCTAKGSLTCAGCCWAGEYIEGPALQGREGFFHIWLAPPRCKIEPFSDKDSTRYYPSNMVYPTVQQAPY